MSAHYSRNASVLGHDPPSPRSTSPFISLPTFPIDSVSSTSTSSPIPTPTTAGPSRVRGSTGSFRGSISTTGPFYVGSVTAASYNPNRMDNWQTLQELAGDEGVQNVKKETRKLSFAKQPATLGSGNRSLRTIHIPPGSERLDKRRSRSADAKDGRRSAAGISQRPASGGLFASPIATPQEEPQGFDLTAAVNALPYTEPRYGVVSETTPLLSVSDGKTSLVDGAADHLPQKSNRLRRFVWQTFWPTSPAAIAIFKCSLSYFIASLFTFVPVLSALLSRESETDAHGRVTYKPANQAHMVATVVVYFNPAKTLGNMLLSTRYCVALAIFSAIVSLSAMETIKLFDHFSPSHGEEWDWISEAGDWLVCVIWIGGTMSCLAWSKLWLNNASFNSGCSMAAMLLYTVVIKEGAVPKLVEILLIIITGVCITNLVCFVVFPSSATSRLQKSISKSLNSFSTLLDLLTSTFLLEKTIIKENRPSVKDAIKAHAAAFNTLKTDLAEAKQERILDGRIRGRKLHLYDAAIGSLGRLAQHLAGLRSSTRLQETLIRASKEGKINLDRTLDKRQSTISLSFIRELEEEAQGPGLVPQDTDLATSVKLFTKFREMAGAEMDTLVENCDDALEAVQAMISDRSSKNVSLADVRAGLASSLKEFSHSSSQAIKRVYAGPKRERGIYEKDDLDEADKTDDDNSIIHELSQSTGRLADGPNETVFLIYFFLFTFEEFAREMLFLLDTIQEIVGSQRESFLDHVKSYGLRKRGKKEKKSEYLYKQFQQLVPVDPSKLQPGIFPRKRRTSNGSILVPEQQNVNWWGKIKQSFWALGARLRDPDMRYAIKTGLGGAILAAPAYTEWGRPMFLRYRGEWALIAYLAAMSQTVGQTNFLSLCRVLGTIIGGSVAILFSKLFPDDPIMLPLLGFLFSFPCFYIITQMPKYTNAGRFILLTYNLSCLFTYNVRDRGNVTVELIAFRRSTSVIIGVLWAAVVSRYWWPFTARRELRLGLSDFCLDLSYLYSKLVTTYSKGLNQPGNDDEIHSNEGDEEEGDTSTLLPTEVEGERLHPHLSPSIRQFMAMELHLQSQLGTLRGLLAQTKNEPRLKGPFAFDFYNEVLLGCERMLDRLHSMRCVTTRDEWDNGIRQAFIIPVNKERREMAGNVILYFYTLSAGFRLRTPLPPYLPPAEEARTRLVEAIRSLEVVRKRSVRGGGRHLLFFAYALAMQEVIAELDYLGELMQDSYGVISQSTVTDFEALFQDSPRL